MKFMHIESVIYQTVVIADHLVLVCV